MKKNKRKVNRKQKQKLRKHSQKLHTQKHHSKKHNRKHNQVQKQVQTQAKTEVQTQKQTQVVNFKENLKVEPKENRSNKKKIVMYGAVALSCILFLTYMSLSFFYNNHFYHNTTINGESASNMTLIEAEEAINETMKSYSLQLIERNDVKEQINGNEIDLSVIFDESLLKLLEKQNGFAWPVYWFKSCKFQVDTILNYNEDLLKKTFNELACLDGENSVEPVNASISKYGEKGYAILSEDTGRKVKRNVLFEAVQKSIDSLAQSFSLEQEGCYEEADIKSENIKLLDAVNEMNRIADSKIIYRFGETTEVVDGKRISEWLSVDEEYKVKLDKKGIEEFVDYLGNTYDTYGKTRYFQTSYKTEVPISGGDYGWRLDREKEVIELMDLIFDGKQEVREPAYVQMANRYGKNDIGDTYVEINLAKQHLLFYKKGKLVVETDIVSGNLAKNHGTPTGIYTLTYKDKDAVLNGADYSSPVDYWMPFNGDIGMHDASWRSSFGKNSYVKNGSHGCINMPLAGAKEVFDNIEQGVIVIVY
jgi:hypothetical protein